MSPEPDVRRRLLDVAAAVLAEEGPSALTARRLTREVGASTMAVYTHFGSMPALVREVVADGFARLYARVDTVPTTHDTLHDLSAMAAAYQEHARAHPQLYAVMFGSASLGGYRLTEEEKEVGLAAFGQIVAGVARAMDAGALRADDPAAVAGQLWMAMHGYLMLEQAGFHHVVDDPETQLLQPMLAHLIAGLLPIGNLWSVFPVGGVGVMLVGVALSGLVCALLALATQRRVGWLTAVSLGALLWSVVVIGLITLIPANGAPGVVYAEGRLETCSWDIGGPAPDGFWIFSGGQRLLNLAVFVPSGALLVVAAARWPRRTLVTVPLGLALLAAYSVGIEWTQLELARIDRACDVTDIIDNVTGAVLGVLVGAVLAVVLRPWARRTS